MVDLNDKLEGTNVQPHILQQQTVHASVHDIVLTVEEYWYIYIVTPAISEPNYSVLFI